MPHLPDGTYVPKHFGLGTFQARSSGIQRALGENAGLHSGYVVAAYPPNNPTYPKEQEWTYDILADVSIDGKPRTAQLFQRARVGMGGSAKDATRQTLKAPTNFVYGREFTEDVRRECTRVFFECEDGFGSRPIIIAFARHADMDHWDSPQLGHNYRWDFNGISTTISKDGEYVIAYSGAILDANTNSYIAAPAETTGTYMKFTKEGSWTANDVAGESILLDKAAKKSTFMGRSMLIQTSEGDLNVLSKGKTNVQAQGNAVFNSTKKVYIGTEGSTEPLVLGNKLAQALKELVDILSTPVIGQAGPFSCLNTLTPRYAGWAAKYARKNTSPFLSKKGFVT